jgi:hypothetical protein
MSRAKAKPRKPSQTINHCPACGSKDLYRMEVDVFCMKCDWLSAEMHVECGGMNNLFAAYLEHFHGINLDKQSKTLEPKAEQEVAAIPA